MIVARRVESKGVCASVEVWVGVWVSFVARNGLLRARVDERRRSKWKGVNAFRNPPADFVGRYLNGQTVSFDFRRQRSPTALASHQRVLQVVWHNW